MNFGKLYHRNENISSPKIKQGENLSDKEVFGQKICIFSEEDVN